MSRCVPPAERGLPGSHKLALRGLRNLRAEGVSVQINSTIAKHNVSELPALLDLALERAEHLAPARALAGWRRGRRRQPRR